MRFGSPLLMPNERGHGYACGCCAKGRRRGMLEVHRRGSAWFRRFAVFGFCTAVLPIIRYDTLDCAVVAIGNANGLKSGTVEVFLSHSMELEVLTKSCTFVLMRSTYKTWLEVSFLRPQREKTPRHIILLFIVQHTVCQDNQMTCGRKED